MLNAKKFSIFDENALMVKLKKKKKKLYTMLWMYLISLKWLVFHLEEQDKEGRYVQKLMSQ